MSILSILLSASVLVWVGKRSNAWAQSKFIEPCSDAGGYYGWLGGPNKNYLGHDYNTPVGTEVKAIAEGKLVSAPHLYFGIWDSESPPPIKDVGYGSTRNFTNPKEFIRKNKPFSHRVSFGGLSIGITNIVRESKKTAVSFAFKRISEKWYPTDYTVIITDDRGNSYTARFSIEEGLSRLVVGRVGESCPATLSLPVGFAWLIRPVEISIPEIAPISKIELVHQNIGSPGSVPKKVTLDFRKVAFPDLDFEIIELRINNGKYF